MGVATSRVALTRAVWSVMSPVEGLEGRRLFAAYSVTDLTPGDGTGQAFGVNNKGAVALEVHGHAGYWAACQVHDLGFAGYATDINDNGVVCGVDNSDGQTRPFVYRNGVKTDLKLGDQTQGVALAINSAGTVVGSFDDGGQTTAYYAPLGGTPKALTLYGVTNSVATGINDKGQIVGNASNPGPSGSSAFFYGNDQQRFLDVDPDLYGDTTAHHGLTNDGNTVIDGTRRLVDNQGDYYYAEHVFTVGSNGTGTPSDKGAPVGSDTVDALDVNASGVIVGNSDAGDTTTPFVRSGDAFTSLQTQIDAAGWTLQSAQAVNDGGAIVGWGLHNGVEHAYLLTPVAAATGSISGNVYNDDNGNGKQDAGEAYSGVRTVFLDINRNNALDAGEPSVQSDSKGHYVFNDVAAGEYHVERVLPSGYHLSNGTNGGKYVLVVLAAGQKVVDVNLGSAPNVEPPKTASISGILFEDADRDGVFDAGEARTGSRTVFLDANRNGKLDAGETSVQSSDNSEYHFTGLAAGTYYVTRVFPAGYRLTNNAAGYLTITVSAGQSVTGANLGTHRA